MGAESGKFGICCASTFSSLYLKVSEFTRLLWLCCSLSHTCSPREKVQTERQNLLSTSANWSASTLPGVHGESRQTDRQRALKKHSSGSLDWCVNLREKKEAALTCWVTPRLRSVFSVFLIYRWFSEHKRAPEMLKNASGTPPPPPPTHAPPPTLPPPTPFSLTSESKTEAGRWRGGRQSDQECEGMRGSFC